MCVHRARGSAYACPGEDMEPVWHGLAAAWHGCPERSTSHRRSYDNAPPTSASQATTWESPVRLVLLQRAVNVDC
jgi:hypothetical protein